MKPTMLIADEEHAAYDADTDVLFVAFREGDVSDLDHEDYVGDGIYLQYAPGSATPDFMEVDGLMRRFGRVALDIVAGGFHIKVPATTMM